MKSGFADHPGVHCRNPGRSRNCDSLARMRGVLRFTRPTLDQLSDGRLGLGDVMFVGREIVCRYLTTQRYS